MNLTMPNEYALCLWIDFNWKRAWFKDHVSEIFLTVITMVACWKQFWMFQCYFFLAEQCVYPDPPHLGTRTYERGYYPYFGCTIGCTDANRRIDRDTPKVYTCGPSGAWSPSNRNIPLRFPSCGCESSDE